MNILGFTAERSLYGSISHQVTRTQLTEAELSDNRRMNKIILAVPIGYCKTVCRWEVCGSPLPGYPAPMCYVCGQECWIHDSGTYLKSYY
jgi:hypothetical protein